MIRLITATPGSGKTCMVIEWLLKELDKGFYKSIYANINGLKIMGIHQLLDDWRKVPDEHKPCLYIVDEAQYHQEFMKETTKANEVGKALSTHRHYGIDFWLITQSPKLLNPYVIENTGEHVHLYRPKKAKTVTVYWWSYAVTNLTKSNFKQADDVQKWRLNPHMFDYYTSTVAVTDAKGRISHKNVSSILVFFVIMGVIVYFVKNGATAFESMQHKDDKTLGVIDNKQLPTQHKVEQHAPTQEQQVTALNLTDLSSECRKGENVSKPECVKWFDDMSKNKASMSENGAVTIQVSYNPDKPYDFHPEPQIQVRDYPRLTGCAKDFKGNFKAYDQQGNIMPNVSQSDCKRWMNGERTFDYTKAPIQVQSQPQQPVQQQPTAYDAEFIAKYQQAKEQGLI
ncbi:zonular occludens toxin domain-containing protein [Acinetobacter radioresistens]|jgi:zona occludens toxin|uniref:zonular occludens toxin domain-containing protein n=1 Tax=Acinetobacter radioresistens TaxID=40216 RepID=UPI00200307A3|nr:zonular occludens toxin domain-containing protein [Acinetobacter radioresistens]MCK4106519.1 hypothetical protein [Acinetobacter radioresistens]